MRFLRSLVMLISVLPISANAAITYIGSGAAADATNDNEINPALHASTATGDALILTWHRGHDSGDGGALTTGTAISGFTQLEFVANGAGTSELAVYCRIATGTDPVSMIPPDGTDATGDMHIGRVHTFRGTHTSCADIVAHTGETASAGTENGALTHPSLTISTDNTLLFVVGSKRGVDWTSADTLTTNSFSWAEIDDTSTATGEDGSVAADYVIQTTAANLSAGSFTLVGDSASTTQSIALSLKPEAASCSGTPAITDIDSDEVVTATQTNVVITGTDFCASQDGGSVTLRQSGNSKTLSVDSWSDTSIQVDMSGVGMGVSDGLIYGSIDFRVTNDAANSDDQTVTVNPPTGTQSDTLSGGVVTLAFDDYGNPNRIFGDPIDVHASGQVGTRNAQNCTTGISDVVVNADASLIVDDACTSFDVDFTTNDGSGGSQLYVGTVGTYTWRGTPPLMGGVDLPNLVFQVNAAIVPLDISDFFVAGDAAIDAYAIRQLSSPTDSTTDVNGAVTDETVLVVDDASVFLDDIGDWIRCGSNSPVQIKYVNPTTNEVGLYDGITCADNAQIDIYTNGAGSVSGLSLNSGTGVLSGTPDTEATTGLIIFRATDTDGIYAESR